MSKDVEFVGVGVSNDWSETRARKAGNFDPEYTLENALAHERSGFDRLIYHYNSLSAAPSMVAAYVAPRTTSLKFTIAVRPNTVSPTYMAKELATLDQITRGRTTMHVVAGSMAAEQAAEGDWISKEERYARAEEFIRVVRQCWSSSGPFSFKGKFYEVENSFADIRCVRPEGMMISVPGSSDESLSVGGRLADMHCFWGEPVRSIAEQVDRVREIARAEGRAELPRFQVSFRPIIGETSEAARERAAEILGLATQNLGGIGRGRTPENRGGQRVKKVFESGTWHDTNLWMGLVAETSGIGNSTALVGTAEEIADSLLAYYDVGVTSFAVNGFDYAEDAIEFGESVIPLVRARVAARSAEDHPQS